MMIKASISILFMCIIFRNAFSANILFLCGMPSPSHQIWNKALAFGLVEKGHNVTFASADPKLEKIKLANFSSIFFEGIHEEVDNNLDINGMANNGPLTMIFDFFEYSIISCRSILHSNGLKKLLNYPQNSFDLIIVDITGGPCLTSLVATFNYPPSVAVTPFLLPPYVSYNFGNDLQSSYIPWYGLPYTNQMNFCQRFWNFIYMYLDIILRNLYYYKLENAVYNDVFKTNTPWQELESHFSIVLANTDPVLNYPQPMPPNIIPVGGLHARPAAKLPADLHQILDKASNGVILFSLGTNVRSDKMGKDKIDALLEAFGQLKETVLWKFESNLEKLPKNVIIRKWLPQNDILAHPNVKLFISHGGALSTQETMYHGVPVVGVPFFVDQFNNIRIMKERRLAEEIEYDRITSKYVLKTIRKVLDNKIYIENMKKISERFRDREETPLQRAVFWVEYALRHDGAKFLKTRAAEMAFYESNNLDVVLFLGFIVFLCVYVLKKSCQLLLSMLRTPKHKEKVH